MTKKKLKPAERWHTDGNYKLPAELVQKFYNKIIKLAETMFGRDGDNVSPVNIHVSDRTRFEPMNYIDIPHRYKIEAEADTKLYKILDGGREATEDERKLIEEEKQEKIEHMLLNLALNVKYATSRLNAELDIRCRYRGKNEATETPN